MMAPPQGTVTLLVVPFVGDPPENMPTGHPRQELGHSCVPGGRQRQDFTWPEGVGRGGSEESAGGSL